MERSQPGPWQRELDDFTRAFSGAFLFGIPLLFTMEMWWIGMYADRWKLLIFLGLALAANVGLAHFAGFKQDGTAGKTVNQAIDALAVGAVGAVVVLLVLNRISLEDPLDSILGKVALEAVPLSIGASVANIVFSGERGRQGENGQEPGPDHWQATLNDLGATIIGSIFIAFNIAPTDEVPMLAAELSFVHQLALIGLSLVITYAIVFASGFDPTHVQQKQQGPFQHPITETAMAYVVSLLVTLVILYLFDRIEIGDPLSYVTAQMVVLGLPAAVGGAAGRLVI